MTLTCDLTDEQAALMKWLATKQHVEPQDVALAAIAGYLQSFTKEYEQDVKDARLEALEAALEANPDVKAAVEASVEAAAVMPADLAAVKSFAKLKG